MSDENHESVESPTNVDSPNSVVAPGDDQADDIKRWLAIGNAVALVLTLFVATVSMFLLVSLSGDVAALDEQAKKSAKAVKAMQGELAALKERLPATPPAAAAPRIAAEARPTNIDAADPAHDCVIRPGDKDGWTKCLK